MVKSGTKNSVIDLELNDDSYRRIINGSGRSKSYMNDAPKSISDITKIFEHKIDFHGQHDQQIILKKESHLNYLDYFCQHQDKVSEIISIFDNLDSSKKKLNI